MNNNNITNFNEYKEKMMPDISAVNVNEPGIPVEFVSQGLVDSYMEAINYSTPDLWNRIEAGFNFEAQDIIVENKRKSARMKKIAGFAAAAALVTVIALPVMLLDVGSSKGEKDMRTTEASKGVADEMYYEDTMDLDVMESESMESQSEGVMSDVQENADEEIVAENATEYQTTNGINNDLQDQLKEMEGIQTDARQLVIIGEFDFSNPGVVEFEIKGNVNTQYDEIEINIGDKVVLSNPLFVEAIDVMLFEEQITLDSVSVNEEGIISGRIVDITHLWDDSSTEK